MKSTQATSSTGLPGDSPVPLESILCTEELNRRPARPPDYEKENRALAKLVQGLADAPDTILQTLADIILEMFQADSAGLSLLTTHDGGRRFYWPAIAGAWKPHVGGGTPREFGPCGDVLDRNVPLLFKRFERRYPYLLAATPPAEEALLIPFYVHGKAVGTIWVIAHTVHRKFDAEDLRQLETLGRFAAAAYQAVHLQQNEATRDNTRRAALNLMEDAVRARQAMDDELAATQQLQEVSMHLVQAEDSGGLYQYVVDAAAYIMRSDFASLQMLHPERGSDGELQLLAFSGFNPEAARFWKWVRADSPTTCGEALRTHKRAFARDVEQCDYMAGTDDLATYRQTGIRACQTTPLLSRDGKMLGMISTHWRQAHEPGKRELRRFDILARQAADLIERTHAEAALRESEERYRDLFNAMDEGYCIIEVIFDRYEKPVDYRFLEVNAAFEKQSGMHDVTGKRMLEFVPNIESHWLENYGRVAVTGTPMRFANEYKGLGRWFDVYAFRFEEGSRSVAVLFTDITERVAMEKEIRQQAEQLAGESRRKDEFLAMLAHELRNPLAPIRNGVKLLRRTASQESHSPENEAAQSVTEMMERQVGQMVRLVDDLLDVNRISRGTFELRRERIELASVVRHAVEAARPHSESMGHELTFSLPPEPIFVNGDTARLAQTVGNLLNNACKFTSKGGRIRLAISREGEQAVIRVRDTGIGIAADQLPRVFEIYTQIDTSRWRSAGGLGIGLALVKNLVALHGGTVEGHSAGVGQGSEFVVRLPILVEPAEAPPPEPTVSEPTATIARCILVVDDNRDAADSLAMLLKLGGNATHTAYDGLEAVEAAARFRPDVVLLDIGLPKLNGHEACRRIREQSWGRNMVLVALTGWGREEDQQKSKEAGFNGHLVKPVDYAALTQLLDALPSEQEDLTER